MAINRYTNLTPSAYKPMTQEQIMTVPLAMRAQHNQAQAQIQSGLDELDKINSLTEHTPELTERKNMLIKNIDSLSSDLANKGFSNDMTGNVIKLNRSIKEELGPQGRLGQIGNAYNVYQKNYADFKKSNEDKKWSEDEARLNWGKHNQGYKGYDEKGDITNIGSLSAPEKVSITDKWKDLSTIMGDAKIATEVMGGGANVQAGPDGSTMIVTTKNGQKKSYNNPQVVSALREIQGELNDPTSALSKSREYSGQSMQDALREAYNIGGSKIDVANGITNTSDISLQGVRNSNDAADDAAKNGIGLVDTASMTEDYNGSIGNANQIVNTYKDKNWNSLTDDQKESYIEAKGMVNNFNNNKYNHKAATTALTSDGRNVAVKAFQDLGFKGTGPKGMSGQGITYKKVEEMKKTAENNFLSGFKKGTKEREIAEYTVAHGRLAANQKYSYVDASSGYTTTEKGLSAVNKSYFNKVEKIVKVENNYRNDLFKHQNNYTEYHAPITSDSESATGKGFKVITDKISDIAKTPQSLNSLGSIISVSDEEGKVVNLNDKTHVSNKTEARGVISKAMQNSKAIDIVDFSENKKGYPTIRLRVTPNEENDGNQNLESYKWSSKEINSSKPMTVELRLGDFSNIQDKNNKYSTSSVPVELLNLMLAKGDPKVKAFATNALNNIKNRR